MRDKEFETAKIRELSGGGVVMLAAGTSERVIHARGNRELSRVDCDRVRRESEPALQADRIYLRSAMCNSNGLARFFASSKLFSMLTP